MHGVLRLIQNELSKIYHQMSWKILTLLLLLLSIGAPLLSYVFNGGGYSDNDFYSNAEKYMEDYEEGSVIRERYHAISEGYHFFADQGYTSGTWQYSTYVHDYISALESIKGCELFIEGKNIDEIGQWVDIRNVYLTWNGPDTPVLMYYGGSFGEEETVPVETAPPDIIGADGIVGDNGYYERTEVPLTKEIAKQIIEECKKDIEDIKVKMKQTFEEYAKSQTDLYKDRYEEVKKVYEAAKTEYEKDKTKIQEFMAAKLVKEGMDIVFDALGRTDLNNLSEEMQNIYVATLGRTFMLTEEGAEYAQISQKKFSDDNDSVYFYGYQYKDYDEYLTAAEQRQDQYYKAVKKLAYSLEHGIPIEDMTYNSTREVMDECLQVNLAVVFFMAIFMAAVIVANEHTSGAVRLLMIRPRARWKILLSKLCCLLIYTVGWIAATSVLSMITNVILYGGNDLTIPYILVGEEACEVTPFLYYLMKMSVYFLPALSMVFLAFLFSVLIKRAVVSMAIPMLINIFGGPASTLFVGKACKACPPLLFTPIPYFQLSNFWCDPLERLRSYGGEAPLDHGMTLEMGVVMFVIYSLILLAAAFVIFKKQQIKN